MGKYAKNTQVSVEKSKGELERILQRYGAQQFMSGWDQELAYVAFAINNRAYKMSLPLPSKDDFKMTPSKKWERSKEKMMEAWEQACRQRWRALLLMVKGKLEGIECGAATLENEFLAYACLPNGETVSQWLQPQMDKVMEGNMPKLLP